MRNPALPVSLRPAEDFDAVFLAAIEEFTAGAELLRDPAAGYTQMIQSLRTQSGLCRRAAGLAPSPGLATHFWAMADNTDIAVQLARLGRYAERRGVPPRGQALGGGGRQGEALAAALASVLDALEAEEAGEP